MRDVRQLSLRQAQKQSRWQGIGKDIGEEKGCSIELMLKDD
jgi:hypothetical protein